MATPSIDFHWYNDEKTAIEIVIKSYEANWTDFDAMASGVLELAKSVAHPIIVILNPQGIPMPKEGTPISHLRNLISPLPPNVTTVISVMENLGSFEKGLGDVLAKISFRGRLKVVYKLEEAYALIPKV